MATIENSELLLCLGFDIVFCILLSVVFCLYLSSAFFQLNVTKDERWLSPQFDLPALLHFALLCIICIIVHCCNVSGTLHMHEYVLF